MTRSVLLLRGSVLAKILSSEKLLGKLLLLLAAVVVQLLGLDRLLNVLTLLNHLLEMLLALSRKILEGGKSLLLGRGRIDLLQGGFRKGAHLDFGGRECYARRKPTLEAGCFVRSGTGSVLMMILDKNLVRLGNATLLYYFHVGQAGIRNARGLLLCEGVVDVRYVRDGLLRRGKFILLGGLFHHLLLPLLLLELLVLLLEKLLLIYLG